MKAFYELMEQSARTFECKDFSFPEHLHKEVEIIYMEEGQACVTIGRQQRLLCAGQLGIVFPNTVHSYEAAGPYRCSLIIFSPEMAGDFSGQLLRSKCSMPFLDAGMLHRDVLLCMNSLKGEEVLQNPALMKGYLTVLTGNLLPHIRMEDTQEKQELKMSDVILQYLLLNYRERLTLSDLSAALGIGKYTLSRFFNRQLECGFNDYVNMLRIGYAQHLLGNEELSVTEIALESGFSSQRSFNRAFRAIHGFSPSVYRKSIRGNSR